MKAGITGHQYLGAPETVEWVAAQIEQAVIQNQIEHGFTSLAIGADQLFASILQQRGRPYTAVIPCEGYELTFQTTEQREQYRVLLHSAAEVLVLNFAQPEEIAFFAAGLRVVELSDFMIAVWNGLPAKGLGGTADVVNLARQQHKRVVHINPVTLALGEL